MVSSHDHTRPKATNRVNASRRGARTRSTTTTTGTHKGAVHVSPTAISATAGTVTTRRPARLFIHLLSPAFFPIGASTEPGALADVLGSGRAVIWASSDLVTGRLRRPGVQGSPGDGDEERAEERGAVSYGLDAMSSSVTRLALLAALVDGDLDSAYSVATTLLDEGVPFETLVTEVLGSVQLELGVRWADGDLTVADEHAATAVAEELVILLSGWPAPTVGPAIVVACAEGDAHSLPARVVAAVLATRGFRSLLLGASVPSTDLGDYLERQHPLRSRSPSRCRPRSTARSASVAIAHEQRVPVVIGGRALGPDETRARRLGGDAWAASAEAAIGVLNEWRDEPPGTFAAGPLPPDECELIDRHRVTLIAEAAPPDALLGDLDLVRELDRLLDVTQSALLLDDATLLADQVGRIRAVRAVRGAPADGWDRALDRLADASREPLPATAALLAGAVADEAGAN